MMMRIFTDCAGDIAGGRLGPAPVCVVATLADLGLDDGEIAAYYNVDASLVARLRRAAESRSGGLALRPEETEGPADCLRRIALGRLCDGSP